MISTYVADDVSGDMYCTVTRLPTATISTFSLFALKSLYLEHVTFTASEIKCVEPFSTYNMLDTLILHHFNLYQGVKFLCIGNSNLYSLTIGSTIQEALYRFLLSTPNIIRYQFEMCDPLHYWLSACKLTLFGWLEEWIWEDEFEGIWVDCEGMKMLFGLRNEW